MTNQPAPRPLARTFVLRVVLDEQAQFHGQASEPGSPDQWQLTVSSLAELQAGLARRLAWGNPGSTAAVQGAHHDTDQD